MCLLPELDETQIDLLLEGAHSQAGAWERGNSQAPAWERGKAGAWDSQAGAWDSQAGAWERGKAGAWERGDSQALAWERGNRFVLVQHGGVGAAFARTFYLENPQITTCVVNIPLDLPQATELIVAEAKAAVGYVEADYDRSGIRRSPHLILEPIGDKSDRTPNLTSEDVLLVTGGGKGIAAECALSLAKDTGVRLALLGRSKPESDAELATNLTRFTASGIQVKYVSVDVSNAAAVKTAVAQIEAELGKITAIIHGAGINKPKLIKNIDKKDFLCTLAPKVQGARNLLAAINPENLRLFVTFGSIIARIGLPGEADYALANEWLANFTQKLQEKYPNCRCLNLEWSVWSGAGMGERLGRIDALIQQGITPIPTDRGIAILRHLISVPSKSTSVIVAGRFGEPPTLKLEKPELPFLRFLEQPRVYYPGVELIVDVEISTDTDPYLNDHVFQNERILPGVIGLEAMAQVVMALGETSTPPIFEDVKFNRPVVVPTGSSLKIRLAALKQPSGKIEVVLRSEQTNFGIDNFRATCCFERPREQQQQERVKERSPIALDPKSDLYGNILFHQGRFQRLKGYRYLKATECLAEIAPETTEIWFGRYLPQELVLGDPAARDTAIHALQACVPHATILPIGIERLVINQVKTSETRFVSAKERERLGNTFIYDLEAIAEDGFVLESWEGLKLQIIQPRDAQQPWAASLLPPYLERQIREMIPNSQVTIAIEKDGKIERRGRSDRAIQQAVGSSVSIWHRIDGKPEILNGKTISVAHAGNLTLAVAGSETIACDIEAVVSKDVDVWRDLLGEERFSLANLITQETHENLDTAATIIWTASECLKKAGAIVNSPLTLVSSTVDGWVWLASGHLTIATFVASIQKHTNKLVLAVLISEQIKHSLPVSNL
ncbi:MAG TPA: hypothetical protein DCY88_17490 [Cyanobacteria bacterium UBA11372]|nr:hypothetical protein [Cyanobacteria bacterium UBA11372]